MMTRHTLSLSTLERLPLSFRLLITMHTTASLFLALLEYKNVKSFLYKKPYDLDAYVVCFKNYLFGLCEIVLDLL